MVGMEGNRLAVTCSFGFRIRENQKALHADQYSGVHDRLRQMCADGGLTLGSAIILPASHPGSPRCQQKLYEDAMCIVQRFGRPHLFGRSFSPFLKHEELLTVTMTANPRWREMVEACTHEFDDPAHSSFSSVAPRQRTIVQDANNRPEIAARIFDLKKQHLLKKIRGSCIY
jgi:hypothetical protein